MNNYINMSKITYKQTEEENTDNECIICFENIDKKFSYVKCYNCNKMYHEYCITAWKYKQPIKNNYGVTCPHCSMNDLFLHEYYVDHCCFSWKLKKNNLKERITNFI